MDRLEEWRMFASVAHLRSFSRTARAFGRSPQAITRAVSALEVRLGARLLNRTTRAVSLTDEGERHLEQARRALAEFELLESRDEGDGPLAGRLSVTSSVLFGQLHVMPLVDEFLLAHPALDLRLLLLDRVVSLAEEGIDLGIRLGALPDSALRARAVGTVRSLLCASPGYLARAGVPRTAEALAKHACIAFTATTPIPERWSFPGDGRRERSVAVRARLVVNTGQAAIDAALAGLGIVRALSYQVAALVAAGRLVPVLPSLERGALPVHIVHLPGLRTRAATTFLDFAAERLRERLREATAAEPSRSLRRRRSRSAAR
ncbi:MAG TPA: LysR family transcriptional regulator [Polyangia bacterium]|jgi:DNA-binding transcriptional LysR family regulator